MAKVYTKEELNSFSRETLMAVILSMQDQISQLNTNMERLIEQIADANNKRYGRSSEKLETISGVCFSIPYISFPQASGKSRVHGTYRE